MTYKDYYVRINLTSKNTFPPCLARNLGDAAVSSLAVVCGPALGDVRTRLFSDRACADHQSLLRYAHRRCAAQIRDLGDHCFLACCLGGARDRELWFLLRRCADLC